MLYSAGSKAAMSGKAASLLLILLATQCAAQASLSNLPDLSSLSTSLGGGASTTSDSSTSSSQATSSAGQTSSNSASTTNSVSTTSESAQVSLLKPTSTSTTDDATSGSIFHLTGLPTIAGASDPTQIVPYTANAPFMQKSNMPEGSVFIIVGAILGFFGACVLAWRGMVALSLQRSVKRAALAQQQTFDMKSHAYPPSAGIYAGAAPPGSSASMEKLAAIPKSNKRNSHRPSTSQGNTPSMYNPLGPAGARGSTQNLFFSPTAGAGLHSHNSTPSNAQRPSSTYLPAGYYAAGSSLPAGGASTTHINAHANRGSMLNPLTDRLSGLRAESAGYQRASSFGPSPPDSPALTPSPNHLQRVRTDSPGGASSVVGQVGGPTIGGNGLYAQSGSSLNLNVPGGTTSQGGRTPSAYLEDLFENHGSGPRERF